MNLAILFSLFYLMITRVSCDNAEYVYVMAKLPGYTKCVSNPVDDVCPVDHLVPDKIQNLPWIDRNVITQVLAAKSNQLRNAGGNDSCINANAKFECSKILYTCKTDLDYVYLDPQRVHALCINASQKCNGIKQETYNKLFSNCSLCKNKTVRYSKGVACLEYPKLPNDSCPVRYYKVPSFANFTAVVQFHRAAQTMLKVANVGENCTNDVLEAICDIGSPACTTDRNYSVSLIGKKRCIEIIKCMESANNTELTNGVLKLCERLPNEDTAKNLSIHTISIALDDHSTVPTTTMQTSTSKMTSTTDSGERLSAMDHVVMSFILWFFWKMFSDV